MGFDIRKLRAETNLGFTTGDNYGDYSFSGNFTGAPWGDFLLGVPVATDIAVVVTDNDGRLYALTDAGIEVLSPAGQHLGAIPVWCITRRCQNLGFGGPDKRTLYVAGGGTLLRIPMLTRGFQGRAK